jgi:histidine triad (HIT) family protein
VKSKHSLEVPSKDNCAFCAYLSRQRAYTIVAEKNKIAVLVTREQRGIPHVLVIPTRHVETILDLADREAGALMCAIRQTARAIDEAYQRPGIAIWQNNGVPASQTINHLHFHVAGTLDKGGTDWGEVEELSVEMTDKIGDKLRPYLHI